MAEKEGMPQTSRDVSYDAIPLDNNKALGEDKADFHVDISDFDELDPDDFDFLEPGAQEEKDEWEL